MFFIEMQHNSTQHTFLYSTIISLIDYILISDIYELKVLRFVNAARFFHNGLKIEKKFRFESSNIDWFEWVHINFIDRKSVV